MVSFCLSDTVKEVWGRGLQGGGRSGQHFWTTVKALSWPLMATPWLAPAISCIQIGQIPYFWLMVRVCEKGRTGPHSEHLVSVRTPACTLLWARSSVCRKGMRTFPCFCKHLLNYYPFFKKSLFHDSKG